MEERNKKKKTVLVLLILVSLFVVAYTFYKEYHEDIINTDIKEPINSFINRFK